ncbi:AraC family transcriptional regulator [Chryseobacterium daeguense]|uniref:AraC family transcriptional regulator n=1 Tax=Chryseobacterium daeguense TaxID=412438 RepID=UPI0004853221|nr:AraC family transcriptional regulator [Chryseobacterium daeguense]
MENFSFQYSYDYNKLIKNIEESVDTHAIENRIKISNSSFNGEYIFCQVDENISVMIIDALYDNDTLFHIRNDDDSFIGMYYNLSDTDFKLNIGGQFFKVGNTFNNLTTLDSSLNCDVIVKKGCKAYNFYIFITKGAAKSYLPQSEKTIKHIEDLLNEKKNTIIRFERINYASLSVLKDLKLQLEEGLFTEFFIKSAAYELLDIYIKHIIVSQRIVGKITDTELNYILISQQTLLESVNGDFPSIESLSREACMSPTKYKNIFKKIIGTSPKSYFLFNKLEKSKKMLISGYSVNEVSYKLGYKSSSHFVNQFKAEYGITPKDFILKF